VRVTDRVAAGTVFVPFNQPGLAVNTLLSGMFTTSVALEAVDADDAEPALAPAGGDAA
jgi:predicted molibdopterin-dependent oxidoreductase YjgC